MRTKITMCRIVMRNSTLLKNTVIHAADPSRHRCPNAAALFSLQLPHAAVTEGFEPLRASHSRRSSACGVANRAIFLPHAAALFSLQLPRPFSFQHALEP